MTFTSKKQYCFRREGMLNSKGFRVWEDAKRETIKGKARL